MRKLGRLVVQFFYELAPCRPDLVLQDYIKIFHPDVLPNYKFTFVEKLN